MKIVSRVLLAALGSAIAAAAPAQSYPSKPVHIVVPYSAGGGTDLVARIVADRLGQKWGARVVVENRPGGTGTIGSDYVAHSPPDGYTMLIVTGGDLATASSMVARLGYDPAKDFAPVSSLVASNLAIAAHPSIGIKSIAALVQRAKAEPGKLSFASCGNGSPHHLAGEMLKQAAHIDIVHVPYKSCAPAQLGALAGEVSLLISAAGNLVPHFKAGKLVPLAVTGPARHPQLPDVPTLIESGFPGLTLVNWMGLFAPAKTPAAITGKVYADLRAQYADPSFTRKLVDRGFEPFPSTPEELRSRMEKDAQLFAAIVKSVGAKVD